MSVRVQSRVSTSTVQRIDAEEVLRLLKQGYTRYKKDDKGYGSIQEKYNLSHSAVIRLFKTPSLKFKKTVVPEFVLEKSEVEKVMDKLGIDEPIILSSISKAVDKSVEAEESPLFL